MKVNCQTELIWGGDHDNDRNDEHLIETNRSEAVRL